MTGRIHERIVRPAQVAGELHPRALDRQQDLRSSQYVSCRQEGGLDSSPKTEGSVEVLLPEAVQRPDGVGGSIYRYGRVMHGVTAEVCVARLFFLKVAAVRQKQRAQFYGARGGVNSTAEAIPDQRRNVTAVVQVCMGQQHSVNRPGRDGKR